MLGAFNGNRAALSTRRDTLGFAGDRRRRGARYRAWLLIVSIVAALAGWLGTTGLSKLATATLLAPAAALSSNDGISGPGLVSAGTYSACGLQPDGGVSCWGNPYAGETRPPDGPFTQVSVGGFYACGLRPDGSVSCWGADTWGQLDVPQARFTQVSAGFDSACGLEVGGAVVCWGRRSAGVLEVPAATFVQVSVGYESACGVSESGALVCWGDGTWGLAKVPQGSFSQVSVGEASACALAIDGSITCWGGDVGGGQPPPIGTFTQVSVGYASACALAADGAVSCWGDDAFGDLRAPGGTFDEVSVGYFFACGLQTGGAVTCWGYDPDGGADPPATVFGHAALTSGLGPGCELQADGSLSCWDSDGAAEVAAAEGTFWQVSAGRASGCAVEAGGAARCWGRGGFLGDVPTGTFTQVSVGGRAACGLQAGGAVVCWGDNNAIVSQVPSGAFTEVSAGADFACALRVNGSLACWGDNGDGQSDAPAGAFVAVTSGPRFACGLEVGGAAQCWGDDASGQLAVPAASFRQVSAGGSFACGTQTDGRLLCWGNDDQGQLNAPLGDGYTQVSAGWASACAVAEGTVTCWGGPFGSGVNPDVPPLRVPVTVQVSGSEVTGGTPTFTETDNAPPGVLGGQSDLVCASAGGVALGDLSLGTYTLDSSTCKGIALNDPGYLVNYVARPAGFDVVQPSNAPAVVDIPVSPTYGQSFEATVSAAGEGSLSVASTTTSVCTVGSDGLSVDFVGTGTCTLIANLLEGPGMAVLGAPQSFDVGLAPQRIAFSGVGDATLGGSTVLAAVGGASGNPVSYSVASSTARACNLSGPGSSTLNYTAAGVCTVYADQAGNAYYAAAPEVSQTFDVEASPSSVTVTLSASSPGYVLEGGSVTYTAAVGAGGAGAPAVGTVAFTANGKAISGCQTVQVVNGQAQCEATFGTAGTYTVMATYSSSSGLASSYSSLTQLVYGAPVITSPDAVGAAEGQDLEFQIMADGFPAPTFSETGPLPEGVSFDRSGLLSGTPATGSAGTYDVAVVATNEAGVSQAQDVTLLVRSAPALTAPGGTVTPASLIPRSVFAQPVTGWAVDPNSAELVNAVNQQWQQNYGNVGVADNDPIYVVPAGTPDYPLSVAPGCGSFLSSTGTSVPVPSGYQASSGSDKPVILIDPSLDKIWELWEFNRDGSGYSACWGGAASLSTFTGVFPNPYGESATGISYAATAVTEADVASGSIDHAIAMTLVDCNGGVYPADRTDCGSAAGQPSEGQWFRFAPGTTCGAACNNPFANMVFQAGLKYGFVVTDKSGAIEISAEQPSDWAAQGGSGQDPITVSWDGQPEYNVIADLPWDELQAIDPPQP